MLQCCVVLCCVVLCCAVLCCAVHDYVWCNKRVRTFLSIPGYSRGMGTVFDGGLTLDTVPPWPGSAHRPSRRELRPTSEELTAIAQVLHRSKIRWPDEDFHRSNLALKDPLYRFLSLEGCAAPRPKTAKECGSQRPRTKPGSRLRPRCDAGDFSGPLHHYKLAAGPGKRAA